MTALFRALALRLVAPHRPPVEHYVPCPFQVRMARQGVALATPFVSVVALHAVIPGPAVPDWLPEECQVAGLVAFLMLVLMAAIGTGHLVLAFGITIGKISDDAADGRPAPEATHGDPRSAPPGQPTLRR